MVNEMHEPTVYVCDDEVSEVARRFESCEFDCAEFNHAKHLTVLVWYLSRLPMEKAQDAMRAAILKFSRHHGKSGIYHETVTAFWVRLADGYLRGRPAETALHTLANEVVARFDDKDLIYRCYSRERILSLEARAAWLEPDLLLLD